MRFVSWECKAESRKILSMFSHFSKIHGWRSVELQRCDGHYIHAISLKSKLD